LTNYLPKHVFEFDANPNSRVAGITIQSGAIILSAFQGLFKEKK